MYMHAKACMNPNKSLTHIFLTIGSEVDGSYAYFETI